MPSTATIERLRGRALNYLTDSARILVSRVIPSNATPDIASDGRGGVISSGGRSIESDIDWDDGPTYPARLLLGRQPVSGENIQADKITYTGDGVIKLPALAEVKESDLIELTKRGNEGVTMWEVLRFGRNSDQVTLEAIVQVHQ